MRRRLLWLLAGLALGGAAGACGKAARRQAIVLVDDRNRPAAVAAAALAGAPLGAPLLYAHGDGLPDASAHALRQLRPLGAAALGGAQVIRIGTTAAVPRGYRAQTL